MRHWRYYEELEQGTNSQQVRVFALGLNYIVTGPVNRIKPNPFTATSRNFKHTAAGV
jgi:hypothetical protein